MLHGGFGTMEDFNSILGGLPEQFRIIGIDSRGQGKSTLGKLKLTYEQMQKDVETLLQFLHIEEAILVGFSDGGMVGYRMAISGTFKVKKLVAIDAPWSLNDLSSIKEILSKVTPETWKEKFPDSYNSYQKLKPDTGFVTLTNALKEMWLDSGLSGGYPDELINQITCQTLIVRGDNDHLFSRKSAAELADNIKNATFLNVPFAAHEAFKDQPEIFMKILNQFLDQ